MKTLNDLTEEERDLVIVKAKGLAATLTNHMMRNSNEQVGCLTICTMWCTFLETHPELAASCLERVAIATAKMREARRGR